jgi:GNAT superfamily N-acetyltransferase
VSAPGAVIRPGSDQDAEGFIALIGACWAEYPGCVLDVDAEKPELHALASHMRSQGGALWTAERAGRVVGMVGTYPERPHASDIAPLPPERGRSWVRGARGSGTARRARAPSPQPSLPPRAGERERIVGQSRAYTSTARFRGTGLADRLLDHAEAHAIAAGARRLALWTDTRFERAHRFYERRGYVRSGLIRALGDLSNTIEFHYAKPV